MTQVRLASSVPRSAGTLEVFALFLNFPPNFASYEVTKRPAQHTQRSHSSVLAATLSQITSARDRSHSDDDAVARQFTRSTLLPGWIPPRDGRSKRKLKKNERQAETSGLSIEKAPRIRSKKTRKIVEEPTLVECSLVVW